MGVEDAEMVKFKKPRPKKCASCGEKFQPERQLQPCCSVPCAIEKSNNDRGKKNKKKLAERRKGFRTRSEWLGMAQKAFNTYIRRRDKEKTCIVCGTHHTAKYSAGHFFTRKARPDLRFNEDNCFKQCYHTNNFTSIDTGEKFRANVINRIGRERFETLQVVGRSDWSIEEIQEIEKKYKTKLKQEG